jgi:hypothetical protein
VYFAAVFHNQKFVHQTGTNRHMCRLCSEQFLLFRGSGIADHSGSLDNSVMLLAGFGPLPLYSFGMKDPQYEKYLQFREAKPDGDPADGERLFGVPAGKIRRWDQGRVQGSDSLLSSILSDIAEARELAGRIGDPAKALKALTDLIGNQIRLFSALNTANSDVVASMIRESIKSDDTGAATSEIMEFIEQINERAKGVN